MDRGVARNGEEAEYIYEISGKARMKENLQEGQDAGGWTILN
jgi:hypothetical protein